MPLISRLVPSPERKIPPPQKWIFPSIDGSIFCAVLFATVIWPPYDKITVAATCAKMPPPRSDAVLSSTTSCVPVPLISRLVPFLWRNIPPPNCAVLFATVSWPPDDTITVAAASASMPPPLYGAVLPSTISFVPVPLILRLAPVTRVTPPPAPVASTVTLLFLIDDVFPPITWIWPPLAYTAPPETLAEFDSNVLSSSISIPPPCVSTVSVLSLNISIPPPPCVASHTRTRERRKWTRAVVAILVWIINAPPWNAFPCSKMTPVIVNSP